MESPPKLAGETLIVHHIPLVHCQVSGSRRHCGSGPFSCPENLGLSRTTSLPERDVVQREALVYSSLIQTSSSGDTFEDEPGQTGEKAGSGGRGGGMASDTSSFTSSNSEAPSTPPGGPPTKVCNRPNSLRHNPFLLNTGEDEDYEDDEDEDGDNLNGYLEDSSFHLHGNSNSTSEDGADLAPFHLHEFDFTPGPFHLHESLEKPWCSASIQRGVSWSRGSTRGGVYDFSANLEDLDLQGLDSQHRHGSSGSTLSMDCGEQEWGEDDDEDEDQSMQGRGSSECCGSHCRSSQPFSEPFSEPFSDCTLGYASDSSCNSSDGVLVNFSAIYSKTNNGVPAKPPLNLNSSAHQSCTSSVSELIGIGGTEYSNGGGAFYLDLHTSPIEPPQHSSITKESADPTSSCQCPSQPQGGTVELDANCNSYHTHLGSERLLSSDASTTELTSCLQSQARLVVATQNYYKLVTCDLSSQSSPSPAGSSVTSCSDEHSKGSPTQPTEYFLFRHTKEEEEEEEEEHVENTEQTEMHDGKKEGSTSSSDPNHVIEGQVYVNISPPVSARSVGGALGAGRLRSRSYERNLDKSPPPRLGSLERMLSCPVRLSEGADSGPLPPPRVTSFAEMARNKRRPGGSPSQRSALEVSSAHSSGEFSPIPEDLTQAQSLSLPPLTQRCSQGACETNSHRHRNAPLRDSLGGAGREARTKAEGGLSSSTDSSPVLVRYSKDQRPTTLPIQPFTFQHQFGKPQNKPLLPLLDEYISQMQARGGAAPACGQEDSEEDCRQPQATSNAPTTIRPSPLGSYSPVRLQGVPSWSGTCSTCSPTPDQAPAGPRPPRSVSCPITAGLLPQHSPTAATPHTGAHSKLGPLPPTPPPAPLTKKQSPLMPTLPTRGHCFHRGSLTTLPTLPSSGLSPMGQLEPALQEEEVKVLPACMTQRHNAHHLSPQALRWREYRRKNPLGVERSSSSPSSSSSSSSNSVPATLTVRRPGPRLVRRNVFDFPPSNHTPSFSRLNGQSVRQLQHYSDFLPDYFSQTERPPEEFCLSPDATTEDSISIDLQQKRGLVKAINTAVDLIVAHFGTSRDPEVKAKLGNSSVSPNVGHLILKYLCPAVQEVLQDGLRAHVLDIIIGQRRNWPWSVVEASTQLGPSTRVLHSLFLKVSQYSELTNHSMRLNAFIFGLLNLRSLEFWFNHIYTHEDIIAAHYHPWGFLPLSQGACQPMFEELLLLLQPLSLLPFDLDLLFEPHQLQKGQEHMRRKKQLCSARQDLDQSARSTFQLMRSKGTLGVKPVKEELVAKPEGVGPQKDRFVLRREGTWPRMETVGSKRQARTEPRTEGAGSESVEAGPGLKLDAGRKNEASLMDGRDKSADRMKGVGEEDGERERKIERDGQREREKKRERDGDAARLRSKQSGWWFQLMQSSQVYIDNSTQGSKFVKWEKRKKGGTEGWRQNHPPPREGVVEGAEANHTTDEQPDPERPSMINSGNGGGRSRSTSNGTFDQSRPPSEPSRVSKGKPSWMGSPPESVLSELKRSKEQQPDGQGPEEGAQTRTGAGADGVAHGLHWGRLFGAGNLGRTEKTDQKPGARSQKGRMPSGWLNLDRAMLDLVVQSVGAGKVVGKGAEPPKQTTHSPEAQQSPTQLAQEHGSPSHPKAACEVRALCHHIATETGHLSFHKGDVLQVLGRADSDWLLCALGDAQGLVPIIYVTLNGKERQGPQRTQ
ncbi:iporin isoform X1 [Electrophorus electricus]|uniref:iporin isoform X1 n=1 Tax=Electrophorus electricus TaxID=8005 RepID=UPI0015CFE93A|nr:iporin isoform X1 [Electrophorus electricus]XP_035382026.1 iporin isoform X1 [Electrophorus electricus]